MRRTALLAVPLALVVAIGYAVGTVKQPQPAGAAASDPAADGVIVGGLGKVSGTPDVLRVQLGVEVRRADVSDALADANDIQNRVRAAARRNGVAAKDMQTADVSLYPSYNNKGVPNGYTVNQSLTLKLRNLGKAGKTIGDAVTAGGNAARLQGVSFALEDNTALLQQARDAAYHDARLKAERYAELAGRSLNQVELVSEQMPQGEQSMPYARDAFAAAAPMKSSEVPIDAGQSQVSVSVTVRWSMR
jgi:uncharacterized protein YggE